VELETTAKTFWWVGAGLSVLEGEGEKREALGGEWRGGF